MNLLIAIRTDFQTSAATRTARRTITRISCDNPALVGYATFPDVVRALHAADLSTQVDILNALIANARTEPVVRLTIVEAFARLIGRYRAAALDDLDDYRSELVVALLAEVNRLADLPPHPYPATMLARAVDRADRKFRRITSRLPEPLEAINDDIDGEILIAELDGDPLQPNRIERFLDT
jgi:hypothetical protein